MRIIGFVNLASGGYEGVRVMELLQKKLGNENVFDIKADRGPEQGLVARALDASIEVRIVVAGGDGTFSWVANAIEKRNMSHCRLIIIPLGSGNDMSRALGWGRKYVGVHKVARCVDYMERAKARKLDVWRLTALEDDNLVDIDEDGISHGARPLMCNYLSLGADAFVELRFNQLRWQRPDKYKSRLGNFRAHFQVGLKYMCASRKEKIFVTDHVDSLCVDDKLIHLPRNLQAILFLNIPSYAAGSQPWGCPGKEKPSDLEAEVIVDDMFVDDHQFEVIGFRSLTHVGTVKALGMRGTRIAQGRRMSLVLKSESTPFQVDGEPWEQRGGEVTMEPGNPVGVLEGPRWKGSSKKSAKFCPPEGEQYGELAPVEQVVDIA